MKLPCLRILLFAVIALLTGIPALHALSPDFYAASSRLASGYWVKVSVTQSGMYCLTDQQLRQWGFSDPSRVKVYGYGARRLPDSRAHHRDAGDPEKLLSGPAQRAGDLARH